MLYALSCFFRDLAVGSDKSMADALKAKLHALPRAALVTLRDHALDLVRVIELAIMDKDDAYAASTPKAVVHRITRWTEGTYAEARDNETPWCGRKDNLAMVHRTEDPDFVTCPDCLANTTDNDAPVLHVDGPLRGRLWPSGRTTQRKGL